jgi:hypothetical protein
VVVPPFESILSEASLRATALRLLGVIQNPVWEPRFARVMARLLPPLRHRVRAPVQVGRKNASLHPDARARPWGTSGRTAL